MLAEDDHQDNAYGKNEKSMSKVTFKEKAKELSISFNFQKCIFNTPKKNIITYQCKINFKNLITNFMEKHLNNDFGMTKKSMSQVTFKEKGKQLSINFN